MKKYKKIEGFRMVIDSVTCDTCGGKCKNTHVDVLIKHSFCDKPEILETICFGCYEKRFDKQLRHVREAKHNKIFNELSSKTERVSKK